MNEEILFRDDEHSPAAVFTEIGELASPSVTVRHGKLTIGNEHYSLQGIVKSSIETKSKPTSTFDHRMRIGSAVVFWFLIGVKLFCLLYRGPYAPPVTGREIFELWWFYVLAYAVAKWYKVVDKAKQYNQTDIVLDWAGKSVKATIANYLPHNRYEELYMKFRRYPSDSIAKAKERWAILCTENVRRIEAISKAVGEAIP